MERMLNTGTGAAAKPQLMLLAESDDVVRVVTAKALETTSRYRVVEVTSVQEALEQMEVVAFAAVLLNPKTEGMDDLRAAEALYLLADAAGCPVIAFSDIPQTDLGLVYPFGFAGVVNKPFWGRDLLDQVSAVRAQFAVGLTSAIDD